MSIFFLCPSKQFLLISFQIQLLEYCPQKQKEQRLNRAADLVLKKSFSHGNKGSSVYLPSCSFAEIFFGYSHRTEAPADQNLWPKKGRVFFYVSYQKLRHEVKVPWINIFWIKRKIGEIVLLCKMFLCCCNSSLFGISLDPPKSVKVWRNRHIEQTKVSTEPEF